jgi:hypothetical protein
MIRNVPTYVAVNVVGALAAVTMLISTAATASTQPALQVWFFVVVAVLMFGQFTYNIVMRLRGRPIPRAAWTRNMSDRQLWLIKGGCMAALAVFAIVIIFGRFAH